MEPVAYGALALKPWEFGRLTVAEFQKLVEGYEWRQEQKCLTFARFAAPIINACARNLKKPITLKTLLGYDPAKKAQTERNKRKSGEELRAELNNLKDEWR
jgi:hypothetical protein